MTIKAVFPTGQDNISVYGLYQWDYGQVLEIESADIGSEIMEVHFACANMSEAIVRPCSFSNGIGTVTIPDQCLEQTTAITAWIYRIAGTTGHTIKTITLSVTARTRPSTAHEITPEFTDKYTELITEINEAVENLESGNITAEKSRNASNATYAATAGNANSANYAATTGNATRASYADTAGNANTTDLAYALAFLNNGITGGFTEYEITSPGIYAVLLSGGENFYYSEIILIPGRVINSKNAVLVGVHLKYESSSQLLTPYGDDAGMILQVIKVASLPEG